MCSNEEFFFGTSSAVRLCCPVACGNVNCFCFIIVAAVIVLGLGALFLLFVLLYSQRVVVT